MNLLPLRFATLRFAGSAILLLLVAFILFLTDGAARAEESVLVVVTGVEGEPAANVEAALELPPGLIRGGVINRRWLRRFVGQVPERTRKALEPFGYYQAEVTASTTPEQGNVRLDVVVKPGPPVLVGRKSLRLEGEGTEETLLLERLDAFPLKEGGILRQDFYETGKGALRATAIDQGYLEADFSEHRILLDREANSADIDLVLDTGPRFRFGEVSISGAETYPDRFLQRYLAFKPGKVFSYSRLGQTSLNFRDADRFREVTITPRLEDAVESRVPVEIVLQPMARRRLRPGVGYGTDTGPRLSLRYKDVNIFHMGHEFDSNLLLAQKRQALDASYIFPSYRHLESYTALRVGVTREDIDTYTTQSIFAEWERVRRLGRGRQGSLFLRLLREDYQIGDEDAVSQMVIPGVRMSWRRYDDPLRPARGYGLSTELRGAHQYLGSDTGLLQLLGQANTLFPLPGRFSLFLRGEAGWTLQNEPLEEIPASLRFFAGGDQSVRGYGYQALGPEDDSGDVVGGKHLLVGSVEVERFIGKNWGVAAFYDAGNAFNSPSDFTWAQAAGMGGRYYTVVGPVKVDVARQLGRTDPAWRLHLSIGFGW